MAVTYNEMFLKNVETQKRIHHQANHDALTDVLNRSSFDRMLSHFENRGHSFALILVDVDHFKAVNDTYGHAVGDQILKKVAAVLTQSFRSVDYVFRIGGDEFAVIMVEMTSDLSYTILNKIEAANETLSHPADGLPPVTLSVGAAFIDRPNPEKSLFQDADTALYYVKEHGRRNCRIF